MPHKPHEIRDNALSPNMRKHKDRSPNYPMIDLGKAVERAAAFHAKFGRHEAPVGMAHDCWKYKPLSGAGNQCAAALRAFGLLKISGQSDQRKVALTEDGIKVVLRGPGWENVLKALAVRPPIYKEVVDRYRDNGLPPDDLLKQYLVWERPDPKFNRKTVDSFIADFRATMAFAKTDSADTIDTEAEDNVDDQDGGDEMSQAIVEGPPATALRGTVQTSAITKQETSQLAKGIAVLQWPAEMSADDYEDFEGWLNLVLRKVKRSIAEKRDSA
jgi:hypothetical protein